MFGSDERVRGGWLDRRTVGKTALGFAVAVILLFLLGAAVGWEGTLERLRTAHLGWVVAACVSTLLCLAAWGKTWHVVLEAVGVSVSYRRLFVTFLAGAFANYVTPMGQAGGEPFVAYILSRDTGATYEQSLASVVTADLLRLLPFFTAGGLGLGYLLFEAGLPGALENLVVVLVAVAVILPLVMAITWWTRYRLREIVLRLLEPIATRTERITIESIAERIDRLFEALERIADSPRELVIAIAFTYVGWVLFALPLYFAGLALETPVSVLLVCVLVPISVIAGSTPLPGGLAAIEGTLVALLPVMTVLSTTDALAVTTVYRLASYWFVIVLGGAAALWVIKRA
ncbi:lysylphosphatidylglycerol synthase transmembrane domain-containing protein [Halopiger goleimassiliensis]|uniref:lysylphosphatidylglycerol synthase transmembrane domain-containing protein n=1 Tax=Halopiger goleimassiliensis TaxID=1293048 RepID=UPI00067778EE|nr:lysylphosphatidylglycerol synthase transmembrane domain-containing protein [Halopiger goleimassiliensis]